MQILSLKQMFKGWFVGNFEPTAYRTKDVEVAVREYPAGITEEAHYHKVATELTAIVRGQARINGQILNEGDIAIMGPGEVAEFETLEPTITVVVKLPGAINDKYVVSQTNV